MPTEKITGELHAHDTGHTVHIGPIVNRETGDEALVVGTLTRVLHEGGPAGPQPTYISVLTEGGLDNWTDRVDHHTPVTVDELPDPESESEE